MATAASGALEIGGKIHESSAGSEPITGRPVRRLTSAGEWNIIPMYHRNSAFLPDSQTFIALTKRGKETAVARFQVVSGEGEIITVFPAQEEGALFLKDFRLALMPEQEKALVYRNGQVEVIDLETGGIRVVVEGLETHRVRGMWGSIDGSYALYVRNPVVKGAEKVTSLAALYDAYREQYGGIPSEFVRLDLATGQSEVVYAHPTAGCDHLQPSPTNPGRWLVDLNLPPKFSWLGDDGQTTRCWLLDIARGELGQELRPRNANRFQMHSNWNADGSLIFYHGRDKETGAPLGQEGGGHYLGAISPEGEVVWERVFPDFHYGHVAPHMTRPRTMLLNNGLAEGLILAVDFANAGSEGAPRVEILARHQSDVRYGNFASYPYPQMSPDGRWLLFHEASDAGTHLLLIDLAE